MKKGLLKVIHRLSELSPGSQHTTGPTQLAGSEGEEDNPPASGSPGILHVPFMGVLTEEARTPKANDTPRAYSCQPSILSSLPPTP